MRILLLLLLLSVTLCSQAAIYKWVDSRGEVHYSDTPTRDAEEVQLSDPTIYTPTNSNNSNRGGRQTAPRSGSSQPYGSFVILSPGRNEMVQASDGRVTIQFATQPGLQPGHYIQAVLDGRLMDERLYQNSLQLENVARGAHMIHASIHDAAGRLMARSNIVQFFVRQTSIIEEGKPPEPPPSGSGSNGGDAPQFEPDPNSNPYQPDNGGDFNAPAEPGTGQTHQDFGSSSKPIPRSQGTSPAFKPNY